MAAAFRTSLVVLPLIGVFALIPWIASSCGSSVDFALEQLRDCPRAVERLGADVAVRPLGMGCGTTEMAGGLERASWSLPVVGNRGSGRLRYSYDRVGGSVRFSGHVEIEDEQIPLPCE